MNQLVVIDVETGGLDCEKHSILTLGAVVWRDGKLSPVFHMHILEPDPSVTPEALKVNGITEEDMKHGMSPSFVITAFEAWLKEQGVKGRATLGGHNIAGFDMGFLRRLYRLGGKKLPFDYHVLDTMSLALVMKFAGRVNIPNVKLDTLCGHFGISIREGNETGRHNSGEDALATAKLFTHLLAMVTPVETDPDAVSCGSLPTS